jgi:hypothetical protein
MSLSVNIDCCTVRLHCSPAPIFVRCSSGTTGTSGTSTNFLCSQFGIKKLYYVILIWHCCQEAILFMPKAVKALSKCYCHLLSSQRSSYFGECKDPGLRGGYGEREGGKFAHHMRIRQRFLPRRFVVPDFMMLCVVRKKLASNPFMLAVNWFAVFQ